MSALTPGTRLGPYEIVATLGAGGMGEVYRARDAKLNRDVALKVLLPAVANDPDRLARFSREAQVLASLNHPNIAHIHGIEESSGVTALVMELVEGEDLSQRIARGAIPLDEALPIARQIAEALEAAHEQGIIHRDLKPANIKVRADGTVKVLDFGLAKAIDQDAGRKSQADLANSPTLSLHATEAGIILGTAAYMSPEQARGKAVDKRTDVWAFGCVLFEMLTGRRLFDGETTSDVIAAVMTRQPDWGTLPPHTPAPIRKVLRRCLEKDRKRRLADAADAGLEVDDAISAPLVDAMPGPPTAAVNRWAGLLPWGIATAALAVAAAVAWGGLDREGPPPVQSVSRFAVQPPPTAPMVGRFEISADGSQLAYAGVEGGVRRLFLRRLDQFEANSIPGTDGASFPFFSPDGQWLAFIAGNKLQKVNLRAIAAPIELCPIAAAVIGVSWPTDDTILIAQFQQGLSSVAAEGGELRPITTRAGNPPEVDHHNPVLLPGGAAVLFTNHEGKEQFSVAIQSLGTGERKVVIEAGFDARYSPTGHLVYGRNQSILAVPFDLRRLEVIGAPVTLIDHVANTPLTGIGSFRLSATGALVFQPEQSIAGRVLTWVSRWGAETPVPIAPRGFSSPRVSPDGKRLAFAATDGDRHDIWTYDLATDQLRRATRDGTNRTPLWSADGRRLTYESARAGTHNLFWQPTDGSGPPTLLVSSRNTLMLGSWTPQNQALIYVDSPANGLSDVLLHRVDGNQNASPVIQRRPTDRNRSPILSPDAHWLAYTSDETGRTEIYVEAFPASGSRYPITGEGGDQPLWSRDGRELIYRLRDTVFSVSVHSSGGFSVGKPVRLFEGRYVTNLLDYDTAPDGRFLMVKPSEEELASPRLHVVLNWATELARRVRATP